MQKYQVNVSMDGRYNFITIFYFFDIQGPISIRNFSSNKIFFKISFKVGTSKICFNPVPCGLTEPRQDLDLNL